MAEVSIRIPLSVILAGTYKVGLTPRDNASKTAVSLPQLVQQTNAFSTKYRGGCVPVLQKSSPKDLELQYRVTCHKEDSDPNGHETRVKFDVSKIQEDQNANDLDVQCSCSCPAFLYWGAQWNLHQRDGLLGEPRPLLQAPTERLDLRSNYVICKHCKAVFERILPSVQHNIDNINRKKEVEKKKQEMEGQPPPTIRRQPGKQAPMPSMEDIEELREAEKDRMLEQEGIVERAEPATNEERQRVPAEPKKPRWRELVDKLKTRMKGWPGGEAATPTPEEPKPEPKSEDKKIQEDLLKEERKRLKGPTFQQHTEKPHVDEGLPYEPRWKKLVKKLKDRVKQWGTK
jgi:SWIM zinc finger